ncbi:MAG TPA: histidine kinase dimerization/phospho-acceptor domain-containing protein [Thermoanaerobaculia bacterium]|jgi:nitrogen fixation/metabolism regulation signal transduction histidine kinase
MEPWLESFARANFLRSADTAHDLKTPLNVAVLNLELLRMRLRKVTPGDEDDKISNYTRAIETELRRMGRIFDTFFILSTPPKAEEVLQPVELLTLVREASTRAGLELELPAGDATMNAHESRIRQALRMFFEGTAKVLDADGVQAAVAIDASELRLTVAGRPVPPDFELTKVFKFYYTDPQGNPDLSLAAARLIAETYGGELNGVQESDKVSLRLSFPLGER